MALDGWLLHVGMDPLARQCHADAHSGARPCNGMGLLGDYNVRVQKTPEIFGPGLGLHQIESYVGCKQSTISAASNWTVGWHFANMGLASFLLEPPTSSASPWSCNGTSLLFCLLWSASYQISYRSKLFEPSKPRLAGEGKGEFHVCNVSTVNSLLVLASAPLP
jgi:hypothetical protein